MDIELLKRSAGLVQNRWPDARPDIVAVLGSGWAGVRSLFTPHDQLPYSEIAGLGAPSIAGHTGTLMRGELRGVEALVFAGRRHFYEGVGWTPVAVPIVVAKQLGAQVMLLTNASGGIREGFRVGDLMVVRDHINFMGSNPLIGPHVELFGPRFPDMTEVYDRKLGNLILQVGKKLGYALQEGIYAAMPGPNYETPAEVRLLGRLGVDAVGMSTVPEAIMAHGAGLRVAGISCISNLAAGLSTGVLTHEHVNAAIAESMSKIGDVVSEFFALLPRELSSERRSVG